MSLLLIFLIFHPILYITYDDFILVVTTYSLVDKKKQYIFPRKKEMNIFYLFRSSWFDTTILLQFVV